MLLVEVGASFAAVEDVLEPGVVASVFTGSVFIESDFAASVFKDPLSFAFAFVQNADISRKAHATKYAFSLRAVLFNLLPMFSQGTF